MNCANDGDWQLDNQSRGRHQNQSLNNYAGECNIRIFLIKLVYVLVDEEGI